MANLRAQLETAYQRVRERMGRKLERQKELYDRKAHGDPYKVGDLVWLHSPAVPRGQAKKLYRPWTGPFRIVRKLSDAVYRVQHTQARRKRLVVHFDRLKPCPPDVRIPYAVTQPSELVLPVEGLFASSGGQHIQEGAVKPFD